MSDKKNKKTVVKNKQQPSKKVAAKNKQQPSKKVVVKKKPSTKQKNKTSKISNKKVYELILKDGSHHFTTKQAFDSYRTKSTEIISFEAHNGIFVGEMFVLKENVHCFVVYNEQQEEKHNKSVSFIKTNK